MAARRKANNPEPISIEVPPTPEFMRANGADELEVMDFVDSTRAQLAEGRA